LILRLAVQMTEPEYSETDPTASFLGLEVFQEAWYKNQSSSLHRAIYMNVLMMYISVAVMRQKPIPAVERNCSWMCDATPRSTESRLWGSKVTMVSMSGSA
jgi:hypothetical protein